jgi:hypothetical protein
MRASSGRQMTRVGAGLEAGGRQRLVEEVERADRGKRLLEGRVVGQ